MEAVAQAVAHERQDNLGRVQGMIAENAALREQSRKRVSSGRASMQQARSLCERIDSLLRKAGLRGELTMESQHFSSEARDWGKKEALRIMEAARQDAIAVHAQQKRLARPRRYHGPRLSI